MRLTLQCLLISMFVVFMFPKIVSAELVARWQFDEGTASTTADSVNNISGIFIKGASGGSAYPTWSTDRPPVAYTNPYSLSFEGLQDGVQIAWPSGLNFTGTAPRSFSFWYKPTANGETAAGNYDRIMSWTSDAFEIAGTLGNVATHRLAFYAGSCWCDTEFEMTVGTWYNITFTYDGTNVKLYVGTDEKFSGLMAGGRNQSGNMYIGLRWPEGGSVNEGINGIIDDVKVYNHALTFEQIENLTAGSDDPDTPPDNTAPTISSITTSSITSTGATITWTTNEDASTKVVYSANTLYASSTSETDTSTRVTNHSKILTGLLSCTIYNFKVVSADAVGNYATSTTNTFTTTGCSGGATPTSATTTSVTTSSRATTTSSDDGRTISVETPAHFTTASTSVVIQIKGLSSDTVLGSIGKPSSALTSAANIVFNVTALIDNITEIDSFDLPVTVSYTYTDADISGIEESTLSMYHYANSTWSQLDNCSVNTGANTITCTAPHFSIFALFGDVVSSQNPSSGSGTSIHAQVANLLAIGNTKLANEIKAQWPWLFSGDTSSPKQGIFMRDLYLGMSGEDVRSLQRFLNENGYVLAKVGPGSPNYETNLFGRLTQTALIKYQKANNIFPSVGYFGPKTRASIK